MEEDFTEEWPKYTKNLPFKRREILIDKNQVNSLQFI